MAKTTKGAQTAPNAQATGIDWSQHQGAGFENLSQSDLGIPFLGIIQKGSPQFDTTSPRHTEKGILGCKPGDIFDTLSNTVLWTTGQAGLPFIPCGFQKLFVEWKTRESGGGLVKVHREEAILLECRKNERNQDILRNGNIVATTAYFYGQACVNEEWKQYVLGMTSTQLRVARRWLNLMTALKIIGPNGKFTPPMFSHYYKLTTRIEIKDQNSWFGWEVNMGGPVVEPKLVETSVEISRLVAKGQRLALPNASSDVDSDPV